MQISLPIIADGEDKSSPLANRIRKNYRHIRKWAKRTNTNCFRLYDRDIKEYPVTIDYYDGRYCIHYFSGRREEEDPREDLVNEIENVLQSIFQASSEHIFWRTRAKRKETRQYEKKGESGDFFVVTEYGLKFKVNLLDYIDTGLFLDHRETRHFLASQSKDKRLLNLFAYTRSFSVHAAAGGAAFTKSVDLSNTYTEWGKENFLLNALPLENHPVIRADCLKFLDEEIRRGIKYDLIIIDPPTISRSKKMEQLFDIQLDYIPLIHKSLKLLNSGGSIYFSTNFRKFRFDDQLFPGCSIQEITEKTVPLDFRDPKIHRCWVIKNSL